MKKIMMIILITGSLLIGWNNSFADGGEITKKKKHFVSYKEQNKQIFSIVGDPGVRIYSPVYIIVDYSITSDNVIKINRIEGENDLISNYVRNQMDGLKIKGNGIAVDHQSITFKFVPDKVMQFYVY